MEYKIIRSKRKTTGIYILKDSSVEVRCPFYLSSNKIYEFVKSKEQWILKKLAEKEENKPITLDFSSKLLLMGKEYPIIKGLTPTFDGTSFCVTENNFSSDIEYLYKTLAKNILPKKVEYFSKIMGLNPSNIKINSAKTRWGSCSGKNSLNFTWRLLMCNEKSIDYVVIHELAHIKEHNHSSKFWEIVKAYMPDYKNAQKNLKTSQKIMGL